MDRKRMLSPLARTHVCEKKIVCNICNIATFVTFVTLRCLQHFIPPPLSKNHYVPLGRAVSGHTGVELRPQGVATLRLVK